MNTKLVRRLAVWLLTVASMGAYAGFSFAESPSGNVPNSPVSNSSVGFMLAKVIGVLILIVALFMFLMRYVSQKNKGFMSGRSLKPVGGLGLGQNKSVQVIEVGHALYVLGVGNDITLLDKIEDPEELEYIVSRMNTGSSSGIPSLPTFSHWLKRITRRSSTDTSQEVDLDASSTFQAVFQEKMQRLSSRQKKVEDMMGQTREDERLKDQ